MGPVGDRAGAALRHVARGGRLRRVDLGSGGNYPKLRAARSPFCSFPPGLAEPLSHSSSFSSSPSMIVFSLLQKDVFFFFRADASMKSEKREKEERKSKNENTFQNLPDSQAETFEI